MLDQKKTKKEVSALQRAQATVFFGLSRYQRKFFFPEKNNEQFSVVSF